MATAVSSSVASGSSLPASPSVPLPLSLPSSSRRAQTPGSGRLHLTNPLRAHFSTLLASYPLKLLAPSPLPSQPRNLATVYTLAYGGGLVAGDLVSLSVEVDAGCGIVMLTQGSTKVFKRRVGIRPLSHSLVRVVPSQSHPNDSRSGPALGMGEGEREGGMPPTKQRLHVILHPGSILLLLPDSISPFRSSRYVQAQRFVLPSDGSASLLLLDWVNSGRGQRPPPAAPVPPPNRGEDDDGEPVSATAIDEDGAGIDGAGDEEIWAMDSYASTNEVLLGDRTIMRERMVLSNLDSTLSTPSLPTTITTTSTASTPYTPVALRCAPYHVYATLLIYGPHLVPLLSHLASIEDGTSQFQLPAPPGLLWSFSPVEKGKGGVVRVAAEHVEDARVWIREVLKYGGVGEVVGSGLWPRCI